jgi:hypothetical protein
MIANPQQVHGEALVLRQAQHEGHTLSLSKGGPDSLISNRQR